MHTYQQLHLCKLPTAQVQLNINKRIAQNVPAFISLFMNNLFVTQDKLKRFKGKFSNDPVSLLFVQAMLFVWTFGIDLLPN